MTPDAPVQAFAVDAVAFWATMAASTLVLALAIEQLYTFWRLIESARDLGTEVGKVLFHGDIQAARTVCERSSSPVADIFIAALNKAGRPGVSIHKAAERERQRFTLRMRKRLWALGSIGALAPFVGLFGTVVGIIRSFRDIAAAGTSGFAVVAEGVSEALQFTASGILVAIMAVVMYNLFQTRGNRAAVEIKLVVDEFLETLQAAIDSGGPMPRTPSNEVPAAERAPAERRLDPPRTATALPSES